MEIRKTGGVGTVQASLRGESFLASCVFIPSRLSQAGLPSAVVTPPDPLTVARPPSPWHTTWVMILSPEQHD